MDDRSQTPEDAALHGQPVEDQDEADPTRLGAGLPDSEDLPDAST